MHVRELFDLSGRTAIVTGGSRGIGKEIATGLGEAGARVVITARREEWLLPAQEELKGLGIECLAVKADITEPADVERLVAETISQWEKIDILVNNAGIAWGAPFVDMPLEKWDAVLNTNAKGALICSQQVGREMIKQQSGNIVNVASAIGMLAVDPRATQAIGYQVSKAALVIMTRQLAVEWAKYNIRVNAIAPYYIKTRLTEAVTDRASGELIEHVPMGRLGREGELKGPVLFLASEASSYVTGHVLVIDGGVAAW